MHSQREIYIYVYIYVCICIHAGSPHVYLHNPVYCSHVGVHPQHRSGPELQSSSTTTAGNFSLTIWQKWPKLGEMAGYCRMVVSLVSGS